MKKDPKNHKNPLRLAGETLRQLEQSEISLVGGASGDVCAGSRQPTWCLACNL